MRTCRLTARPRRDGAAVRTALGMIQEGTNLVGDLRREDVLELAGLLLNFVLILYFKCLRK